MVEKVLMTAIAFVLVYMFVLSLHEEEIIAPSPLSQTGVLSPTKDPDFIYQEDEDVIIIQSNDYDTASLDQMIAEISDQPDLATLIHNGVSFDITKAKESDFERIYELYEEELPTNIIDSGRTSKIKSIDVNVAHKPPYFGKQPVIAIVIDDMGISHKRTKDINTLQAPITSSYLPYATHIKEQIEASKQAGHEIIAHIPMEAKTHQDVAPLVLELSMDQDKIQATLHQMLDTFQDIKGINNHMGSKFTENKEHMSWVMQVLQENQLFFLDSKTSAGSQARQAAADNEVKYAARNVFLDNNNDYDYIMGQLKIAERLAAKNGYAIAIGHPKSQTYLALKDWITGLEEKNIRLVHLSEIIETLNH